MYLADYRRPNLIGLRTHLVGFDRMALGISAVINILSDGFFVIAVNCTSELRPFGSNVEASVNKYLKYVCCDDPQKFCIHAVIVAPYCLTIRNLN